MEYCELDVKRLEEDVKAGVTGIASEDGKKSEIKEESKESEVKENVG